jgi:uncharacterized membrane protein YccC
MASDTNPTDRAPERRRPSNLRIVAAALLDFFTIFFVARYVIALIFGGANESGFHLNGGPALLLLAGIVIYFWAGSRYAGGTIWQRILGTR